ncbi:MAG: helix-turn-helix transcriptional regulator [Gemmatimonadota bacterium]|nr:helix-turn-helix transcriptional regulator [Gemmatimonadota bacterium]
MTTSTPTSPVGRLLRHWRDVRGMSQLDLALTADVSARHVSFVETGRSTPSREMVLRLADVLAIPLREQNALLEAAGYARLYRESELTDPELEDVRRVFEFILERHEPYSAVVVDRAWNVVMANRAHGRVLAFLLGEDRREAPVTENLLDLTFDPDGARPYITNWEEVARVLLDRVHREVATWPDDVSEELLERLLAYPGVPERWRVPDLTRPSPVVIPIRLRKDGVKIALFTAISTLGTPQDVTLQELRIESFFPADEASDAALRGLGRG